MRIAPAPVMLVLGNEDQTAPTARQSGVCETMGEPPALWRSERRHGGPCAGYLAEAVERPRVPDP